MFHYSRHSKKISINSLETRNDNLDILQKYFNELIVRHSINRPPFSIQIFKLQDVIKITEYLSKNYLSNYKLYKYVFTSSVRQSSLK